MISVAITRLDGEAEVRAVYEMVERIAPEKVAKNENYREKIRQKLQWYFVRVRRGVYTQQND